MAVQVTSLHTKHGTGDDNHHRTIQLVHRSLDGEDQRSDGVRWTASMQVGDLNPSPWGHGQSPTRRCMISPANNPYRGIATEHLTFRSLTVAAVTVQADKPPIPIVNNTFS